MNFKYMLLFLAVFVLRQTAYGQSARIDSLNNELRRHPAQDTFAVSLMNAKVVEYSKIDPDQGLAEAHSAVSLALKLHAEQQLALLYNSIALIYMAKTDLRLADSFLQQSRQINERLHDEVQLAMNICNIGIVHSSMGDFDTARSYIVKARKLFKSQHDLLNEANALHALGYINSVTSNIVAAIEDYDSALVIYKQINNRDCEANILQNLGMSYLEFAEYTKAISNFQAALDIYASTNNNLGRMTVYGCMGKMYDNINNEKKAVDYYQKSMEIAKKNGVSKILITDNLNIGNIHLRNKNFGKAMVYFKYGLDMAFSAQEKPNAAYALKCIGNAYYAMPDSEFNELSKDQMADTGYLKRLHDEATMAHLNKKSERYFIAWDCTERSLAYWRELQQQDQIASTLNNLAYIYKDAPPEVLELHHINPGHKYAFLIPMLDTALMLARSIHSPQEISNTLLSLSEIYESENNMAKAFQYYKQYIVVRDSALNDEKKQEILKKEMQYGFDKKEEIYKLNEAVAEARTKNTIYFFIVLFVGLGALSFFVIYRNRIKNLEKLILIRNNIASNLHDEIGSTLSSISIMSEIAQMKSKDGITDAGELLRKINSNSREIVENMKDIVWSINPENDDFDKVIARMRQFAAAISEAKDIILDFQVLCSEKTSIYVGNRQEFYLVFKEAMINAVKYAAATKIEVQITVQNNRTELKIIDNGCGFDKQKVTMGNGILNMKRRAEKIGGELEIISQVDMGTTVHLKIDNKQ